MLVLRPYQKTCIQCQLVEAPNLIKKTNYFHGNKYFFICSDLGLKIVGSGMSVVVDFGIRQIYTIELHADENIRLFQVQTLKEAIKKAESIADQYQEIFASSLFNASWRKEPTYDFQKIALSRLGCKQFPMLSGNSANKIGNLLSKKALM